MLVGLLRFFALRGTAEAGPPEESLGLILSAADALLHEGKERACSFCRKTQTEARLVGGLDGFICESCARDANAHFQGNK